LDGAVKYVLDCKLPKIA